MLEMIGGILVSLKYLALHGRIEGFDHNVDSQEQMKRFWNIHVRSLKMSAAEQRDLKFTSN